MIIPQYLPNEYRECADEDGVIQKYKIPVDDKSFLLGFKVGRGELTPCGMCGGSGYWNGDVPCQSCGGTGVKQ